MKTDDLRRAWVQFKIQNEETSISEVEIFEAIKDVYEASNRTERFIRNATTFSFIILFCQQC